MSVSVLYIVLTLLGLCLGSFAGASVWRLRARQLVEDKKVGEKVNKREYERLQPLTTASLHDDRSRCLSCGHTLRWYDLVPLVSWLSTRGRCRYCRKPIGWFEPVIELATAALFVGFFSYWVQSHTLVEWPLLVLWVGALTALVIVYAYDAKWFLIPDVVSIPLIIMAGVIATWEILTSPQPLMMLYSTAGAVTILSGLYLAIWLVSKGMWVGFGDVKLGLALGLLLGSWQLAFLALFLANFIGTLIVLPGLIRRKMSRKTQIPFGPLLIIGFLIALLFGYPIIDGYIALTNQLVSATLML